jgi:hypothetical protein
MFLLPSQCMLHYFVATIMKHEQWWSLFSSFVSISGSGSLQSSRYCSGLFCTFHIYSLLARSHGGGEVTFGLPSVVLLSPNQHPSVNLQARGFI